MRYTILAGTGWDEDLLRGLGVDLREDEFNLDVLGFSVEELNAWLAQEPDWREGVAEEDAIPEPLEEGRPEAPGGRHSGRPDEHRP